MSGDPASSPARVTMTLWRDRDPVAMPLAGMYAGRVDGPCDPLADVADIAARGVQLAQLADPVDLADADGAAAVAALAVIRELTSYGIAVDWVLRLPVGLPDATAAWCPLSHLYPPAAVLGDPAGDAIAAQWRASFHVAKCGYRRGPGFIEIRDRRTGTFKRLVIRTPPNDQVITSLLHGVPATALADRVTQSYVQAGLLHQVGRFLWWVPYRIRRWPLSTTIP